MSKNKFQGFAPRPTKGALVAAAKQETGKGEPAKAEQPKAQEVSTEAVAAAEKAFNESPPLLNAPTEAKPAPAAPKEEPRYMIGKKYSPKTDRNSETWGKLTKALNEGPKTMKELTEVVKGHGDFLGYMTRGGHVVPYTKPVAATAMIEV